MAQVRIKQIQGLGGTLSTIGAVVDDLTRIVTIRQIDEVPQSTSNTNIFLSSQVRKSNICTINVNGIDSTESFSFEKDGTTYLNDGSVEIPAGSLLVFDTIEAGYELSDVDEITLIYESGLIDELPTDLANGIFEGTQYDVQGVEYSGSAPVAPTQSTPGADGTSGTSGTSGLQGAQGAQGAQGSPGQNGAVGFQGAMGAQGVAGKNGAQGAQGAPGIPGTNGQNGTNGQDGTSGVQGAQGAQGAPAPSGPITAKWKWSTATIPTSGKITTSSGSMHAPTITGITFHDIDSDGINRDATLNAVGPGSIIMLSTFGSPYAGTSEWTVTSVSTSGSYVTFTVTNNLSNGAVQPPIDHLVYAELSVIPKTIQGPTGAPGFNGAQGAPGSRGGTGAQGAIGASGSNGTSGTSGLNGPKSANDVASLAIGDYVGQLGYTIDGGVFQWDGNAWIQRADLRGPQGAQGSPGLPGTSGVDGGRGGVGAQGAQGINGTSGSSGINGTSGTSGVQGAQGATGAQGPAGSSNSSTISPQKIVMPTSGISWYIYIPERDGPLVENTGTGHPAYAEDDDFNQNFPPTHNYNLTNLGTELRNSTVYNTTAAGSTTWTNEYYLNITNPEVINPVDPTMDYVPGSLRGIGRNLNLTYGANPGNSAHAESKVQNINKFVLFGIKKISTADVIKPKYKAILLDTTDDTNDFYSNYGEFEVTSSNSGSSISLEDCIGIGLFYMNQNNELVLTNIFDQNSGWTSSNNKYYASFTYNLTLPSTPRTITQPTQPTVYQFYVDNITHDNNAYSGNNPPYYTSQSQDMCGSTTTAAYTTSFDSINNIQGNNSETLWADADLTIAFECQEDRKYTISDTSGIGGNSANIWVRGNRIMTTWPCGS